jgi:predicted transcriptional regulator
VITCPFCGFENIDGVDVCEQCEEALTEEYLRELENNVERALLDDRITALRPKQPITVPPDMPVGEVMLHRSIRSVVVVEDAAIVGIFTERDALFKLNVETNELRDRPVSEFMKPRVETLDENAKIAYALERMELGGYRHVPIVNEQGEAIGIVSARDVLMYLTDRMKLPES